MIHQISNSIGNYNYNIFIYEKTIYKMHFHKNFEIIYVTDGEMQLTYNEIQTTMLCGECLIIPPNVPHSLDIPQGSHVWVGVFSEDFSRNSQRNTAARFFPNSNVIPIVKAF